MGDNLDKAIAESGPKTPYEGGWKEGEVEERGQRIDDVIDAMKTGREIANEIIDGVEEFVVAGSVFVPQAAPFVPAFVQLTDFIQDKIARGVYKPEGKDAETLFGIYAAVKEAAKKKPAAEHTPTETEHTHPEVEPHGT